MKTLALLLALASGASALAAPGDRDRDMGAASSAQSNQTRLEDSMLWKKITEQVTLSYYVSVMGPTLSGPTDRTYNVFLEGEAPQQLFHAFNLRWQMNPDWAVGVTIAGIQHYTDKVVTDEGFVNDNNRELFNMRTYVAVPRVNLGKFATMFNTFAIEWPTTPGSTANEMKYGLVLSQSLAFKLPPSKFAAGWLTQLIRYEYEKSTLPPPFPGGLPTPLQTTLFTTGPYMNYQLAPQWQIASLVSFDWDQRGNQTDKLEFNNNLPDRIRLALNYFFQTRPFTHVGLYTQALTNLRRDTTILGLDFSVKF